MFSWIPLCRFLHAKSLLEHVEDVSKLHMCMRWNSRYTLNGDFLESVRRINPLYVATRMTKIAFYGQILSFGFHSARFSGKFGQDVSRIQRQFKLRL